MATKIADIYAAFGIDDREYNRKMDAAEGKAGVFSKSITGFLERAGQRGFDALVNGFQWLIGKMGDAVQASSNLNESMSKTNATFGSSAQSVLKWSENSATAFGLSQRATLDLTSSLGNMFIQLGANRTRAVELSQGMVGLAADLASYNNVAGGAEEVSLSIASAFRGEYDAVQRYIPTINAAAVEQRAMAMTGKDNKDALTQLDKALAVHELILRGAGAATGDFARTAGEAANGSRTLAAQFEDGSARLGNSFRPAVAAIQNILIGLAPQMFGYAQNITDQLANGLAAGIRSLLPVIMTIRQLFTYWFAPGSPPRVLPDIDKWGAAAMQQFLGGFSSVDVKSAFAGIGNAIENILRSDVSAGKADEFGLVGRVFGTRNAIVAAVAEFSKAGSVSESTINRIARSAGTAGPSIGALVSAYFNLQTATTAATRAQDNLNRITERYDAILNPLRSQLDGVRAEQQALANQQRLIAAQNTLANFDSTDAEKRAAALEIQQISLEQQIATTEQQKAAETDKAQAAVDGAKAQETAAQKQLDIAQATIDQQVETNNLLGEQKRLVEQLAAAQEAAAKKAESEAEQAANKAKAEAEKRQRELDQIAEAQLRYRLQVADTAGDIAIVEEELSKLTPGTAEYYEKLTQLDALHKQYNAELEAAAKKAAALGATDISAGLDAGVTSPLGEASKAGENLANALKEAFAPIPGATENVSALAQKIEILVDKIGALFGVDFSSWSTKTTEATTIASDGFALYGQKAIEANSSVDISTDSTVEKISGAVDVLTALVNGDWATLWQMYKTHALEAYSETDKDTQAKLDRMEVAIAVFSEITNFTWARYFEVLGSLWDTGTGYVSTTVGGWLSSLTEKFTGWFTTQTSAIGTSLTGFGTAFYNGGAKMVTQFLDGLKSAWGSVETWFTGKLTGLRAQLPFSEPKDPASPLRGLKQSGAALVDMFQSGMDAASLNINPLANNLLAAPAGATTNTSNITIPITVNISGNATEADVRRGVASGADDIITAIRAAGVSY